MRFLGALFLAGVVTVFLSVPVAAQTCTAPFLYTVSEDDDILRVVELPGGAVVDMHTVDLPNFTVTGCSGIAIDGSGVIYLLVKTDQAPPLNTIPFLCTYDLDSGFAELVGSTLVDFGSLTFDSTGVIYAISADDANPPRAFCELSLVNGQPTDLCRQPAGEDGEAVAVRQSDDLRFHASGVTSCVFNEITSTATFDCANSSIDISGTPLQGAAMESITWFEAEGAFLWKQAGPDNPLYLVTDTGDVTPYGNLDHSALGMALVELPVPCPMDCFIRGDVDGDAVFSGLVDALYLLNWQFSGGPNPPCLKAGDADDDGTANGLVDSLYILNHQFAGGPAPLPPYPGAGEDPTPDSLTCDTPLPCP